MPKVEPQRPVMTIDAAREALKTRGLVGKVSTARLMAAARELNLSLDETLKYLSELLSGGQGQGPFPETVDALEAGAK